MIKCLTLSAGLVLMATAAAAQTGVPVPPAALAQVAQVRAATASFADTAGAATAGFGPVLGWLPTMGTHWINQGRMARGKDWQLTQPSQLMFSPINGKNTLVGAAYSYFTSATDSVRPNTFVGNPPWHEHPQFAPPGQTLTMLHVWFVASPDGPFAGHNPYLPFWAAGLVPPDTAQMHDMAMSMRVRRAALALSEIVDTMGYFPNLAGRPGLHEQLVARRDSVRALVPLLAAAQKAGDWTRWSAAADRVAAQWDGMRAAYLAAVASDDIRARMVKSIEMMMGTDHMAMDHR